MSVDIFEPSIEAPSVVVSRSPARRGRLMGLRVGLAIVISLILFFPFYWMVVTAFSTRADLYAPGLHLWPAHLTLDNFVAPIKAFPVVQWFQNSLIIALATTVITVVCNLLAGFAFAKLRFRGKNPLFLVLLSTMMIPPQAIMIPQFKLSVALGLYGNIWSVILPESAVIFGVFLARQFFLAIPDELLEAARVDGETEGQIVRRIIIPLLARTLTVITTTMIIVALKVFDIVYVMTSGAYGTDVIARQLFARVANSDYGRAAAVGVVLLLAVTPVLLFNVKRFREQEERR